MNQFQADDPSVDGYLALCEKYNVPAVFHSDCKQSNATPEVIYAAAKRHPNVPVILYHMGFLGPHQDAIAIVKKSIEQKDAQLYLETSQAEPAAVLQAVKELGAGYVLFGTDATYYGKEHYEKYVDLVNLLRTNLSEEEFVRVMRENAIKLFRLENY